jgi:hypothetical protein
MQTCRRWRSWGCFEYGRGWEETAKWRRDDNGHCFENNRLGSTGREREEGWGGRCLRGAGEEGRGGPYATVSSARRPSAALDRRARVAALLRAQGRAVGRDRRIAGATDRRGQAAMGPGSQQQGVGESEVVQQRMLTCRPGEQSTGRCGLK